MDGRPLSAMAPAINRFLTQQREDAARLALINELRKGGPPVRVMIEAPRFELDVSADDPALGDEKAPVTVVEFSDFQCPYCLRAAPTLKKIRQQYGDRVRLVWKDFPLTQIHPEAFKAGEAGHCAAEQGKFWDYHDQLFSHQGELRPDDLKRHATTVGLDLAAFNVCLDTSKYSKRVLDGVEQGTRLGVNSTPTVFINGRRISGAQAYDVFAAVIEEELARK